MNIQLTPEEILILHQATRKITEFADRSTVIADALGIDLRQRKNLRRITDIIRKQAQAQTRHSKIDNL